MADDKFNITIKLYDKVYQFNINRDEEEAFRRAQAILNERLRLYYSTLENNISEGDLSRSEILLLVAYEFAVEYSKGVISNESINKRLEDVINK